MAGIPGYGGYSISVPVALPQNNISNQANQGELLSLSKHSMWLARQNFLKGSRGDGRRGSGWVSNRENCKGTGRSHVAHAPKNISFYFRKGFIIVPYISPFIGLI